MYLTELEQRELAWYKVALGYFMGDGVFEYAGICSVLKDLDPLFSKLWIDEDADSVYLLPLLYKHRTKVYVNEFMFWFRSHEERVVALNQAIAELEERCKLRRELRWYERVLKHFEENMTFNNGVCDTITEVTGDSIASIYEKEVGIDFRCRYMLPVLNSFSTTPLNLWWFRTREERMEGLRNAIAHIKNILND